ncbi:hypothetical protein D9756_001816 [Leucocoprinus leucothites]|uniref:Uncharacterized protein n=1 Tax=Leucocoprinus leucothites TaxID=201217 RepID=A0A8H5LI95_9AGAR|nr:hypothetical protein D9756_001816 [Leucoagaricus leucothites]
MGHGPVKEDPAIERFNTFVSTSILFLYSLQTPFQRESAYMRFKWTPGAARAAFIGFIGVPLAIYYFADKYHVRWDWVGKRRGQSIDSTAVQAE